MVDVLRKDVPYEFDDAVKRVEEACESEGFGLQLTKGLHDILKQKRGIEDYPKFTVILVCNPDLAKTALEISKDIGTIFPCSFTVYEEDGLAYFKNDIYLYDKIIEESVEGNKKSTFTIPEKRMISVKKNAKPLSN